MLSDRHADLYREVRRKTQAIARIREVRVGDEQGLAEAIDSWSNPETESEIERFMKVAADEINSWSATHLSAISREEAAAGFKADLKLPGEAPTGAATDAIGQAVGVAGWVADLGGKLGKVLGNREAALRIGHFFGHKFKPYGAIKAGKAIGRGGAVLVVAAVAADAVSWANQAKQESNWDSKRDSAVDQVELNKDTVLQQLLADPDGPWTCLAERTQQVRDLRNQYRDRQIAAQEEAEQLQQRLSVADGLVLAAQELRKATGDESPD
jgi:hypothetical protein